MKEYKIAFIGGGNMAYSLIGGLVAGNCPGSNIHVADPNGELLQAMRQQFGIIPFPANNPAAIAEVDAIVLAVKPQILAEVAREVGEALQQSGRGTKPLIISIAAGIRSTDIARWLGGIPAIVRTMPNTPSLLQCGATGMFANTAVSETQKSLAESILRAVGTTVWVADESQLDAVTALSGSGPAYFFLFMEAMETAGETMGLPADTARMLTLQTAFGAAKMALERPESSAELRKKVTSPNGTTEAAIGSFQQQRLEEVVARAMRAARDRSIELADELGGKE
jgi:pyrroline-5-carboxylate reductase